MCSSWVGAVLTAVPWYINDQSIYYDEKRRGKEIDLLAAYEDTGLEPEEIKALIPPPNDPLTLEKLQKMG